MQKHISFLIIMNNNQQFYFNNILNIKAMSTLSQIKALQAKLDGLPKKQYYTCKAKINALIRQEQRKAKQYSYYEWIGR